MEAIVRFDVAKAEFEIQRLQFSMLIARTGLPEDPLKNSVLS